MKKLLLASAVSALFAAPAAVLAQAKPPAGPPVPTLDKVLEASGISVSGYIDAGYMHSDRNLETAFSTRVFDSQNNSFVLHQFGLPGGLCLRRERGPVESEGDVTRFHQLIVHGIRHP